MQYLDREIANLVKEALGQLPVVVLTGMRQSGKSTLLLNEGFLEERYYTNLDVFTSLEEARENPEAILDQPGQVTIDEAQRAPDLLLAIKVLVDAKREPGRFLLSGSANFLLMEKVSESLAGRAIYLYLRPMTRREVAGKTRGTPFLVKMLAGGKPPRRRGEVIPLKNQEVLTGGMPPVCTAEVKNRELWLEGYEQTYVERDVRNLASVGDLASFRRILRLAANRTAQILNISGFATDAGVNVATAKRYLGLLETSFMIFMIPPYLGNRASRLIKSPKVFLADSGLASHLIGLDSINDSPLKGHLFETYVAQNLLAIMEAHQPKARLHFWQVQGRHEVDFVIEHGSKVLAVEVKSGTRWSGRDLSGLKAFLSVTPNCTGAILAYNGEEQVSLGDRLWAVPLGTLLS